MSESPRDTSPTPKPDAATRERVPAMKHGALRRGVGRVVGWVLGAVGTVLLSTATPLSAQDVELWGQVHGTRPPDAYYEELRRNPDAYRFQIEGAERLRRVRDSSPFRANGGLPGGGFAPLSIGPRDGAVVGTFRFPLVLGTYSDGPAVPEFTAARIQDHFFDGPNEQGPTVPEYYDEISGGLVELQGVTFDWFETGLTRSQVTLDRSGLWAHSSLGVGAFIEQIVLALDAQGLDWSPFDSDGDGYVDVLTVIHPGVGAECENNQNSDNLIWSHRWNLADATNHRLDRFGEASDGVRTSTPAVGGGFIHVNDYTIQPLLSCDSSESSPRIAEIGTFAHELGHGFGLPDLYRTGSNLSGFYAGVGNWDLMGTGSYGCRGGQPELPCHMGAWSKAQMGWVTVDEIPPGTQESVTLEPVETGRRVLRVPARDGSGDYVLLENRQPLGTDIALAEPGLLIWQIDAARLDATWVEGDNLVNSNPSRMGVWLRQADGRDDLTRVNGGRGDPGDPFPGCIKENPLDYGRPEIPCGTNEVFHAGQAPFAFSHLGGALGVTLTGIGPATSGPGPSDMAFELDTRLFTLRVEAEHDGAPVSLAGFELDGESRAGTPFEVASAPFQTHDLVAAGGIPSGPDERVGFVEWDDGAPRSREVTTGFSDETLTASYGVEQIRLGVSTNDPADGVAPATFLADPGNVEPEGDDFWFAPGTEVSVTAIPRTGFSFREWVGASSPGQNPFTLVLDDPTRITANFDLAFGFEEADRELTIEAAVPQEIAFGVSEANEPISWTIVSGTPPAGLSFSPSAGRFTGAATETGTFAIALRAVDALGLEAEASVLLSVERPDLGLEQLASSFVAATDQVSFLQKQFLDRSGNGNGSYDVGDFRAYVLANPDLPESSVGTPPAPQVVPLGPVREPEVRR